MNGFFLRNGGAVLEQTIRLFNGKSNPLRSYSSQQFNNATNNFHDTTFIHLHGNYGLYKGFSHRIGDVKLEEIATEVAVASQMSNHKNVLKLLGYCLDSKFPMLRTGIGIANALAYLHHGHSKTFIHREIFKEAVYLDQDYGAKLFDFQSSIPIPDGETHGLWDICLQRYTERSDVYAFGALFSELLTGKSLRHMADSAATTHNSCSCDYWFDAWKNELKDNTLGEEGEEETRLQIMECAKLVEKGNNKNKSTREEDGLFMKNGGAVLEQTILLFNGKSNPLRSYSSHELNKATHNFNPSQIIHASLNYTLYKGSVIVNDDDEEEISVKMFFPKFNNERHLKMIANEVAVASQMSNHRNVLKLLGYCLDSELPMLVYELPFHGNLLHISELAGQAPFERKLKICIGIANAISYLHHGHSKTFINRDIRRGQVFLDKDYNAKLCSFYASIPIPEGETHVDADFFGTKGFTPPEVAKYGRYTERSDVYDFGILLSELLTGKTWGQILWDITDGSSNYDWNGKLKHELETNALVEEEEEENEEIRGQIMECAKLVERCTNESVEERPNMVNTLRVEGEEVIKECAKLVERCIKENVDGRSDMVENIKSCTKKEEKNGFFIKNGGAVLEQTIRLFNGKSNPLRSYSSQQLKNATNNFHDNRFIYESGFYKLYKGVIHDDDEDCEICVKTYHDFVDLEMIATEVAVGSQMSNHNNVLKLLGYCLDTELPMLVYDHFPIQGKLSRFLLQRNKESPPRLPFETKLRIGIGVANAVAYLHHGHSKTFINRDIHSRQVLLEKDYGPKLFNFFASIPIPEGETHVDADVFGTYGFVSPEAAVHGRFTERSDAYAFGVLLSELLTGKSWPYMADPATWIDGPCAYWFDAWKNELKVNTLREEREEETRLQIMECAKLVEMCIKENVDERPDMVEVAKALIFIKTNKTLLP
ncbi:hypothetical protein G4B88_003990 [Cannabis sativa]|uniref:Protein kinase domain-containing protein n=1 Tax=Cannabis sativa TaxID=3483 RepID=A0A7J6GXK1_CANSA|nr:hypothetical protein G4B88_003990 [Cannabis sativa]